MYGGEFKHSAGVSGRGSTWLREKLTTNGILNHANEVREWVGLREKHSK